MLGLSAFDENALYEALDWAASQQQAIEDRLYQDAVRRTGETPALMLYDVSSSYLEGEQNELGAYGYHRDGKVTIQVSLAGQLIMRDTLVHA